MLATDLHQAVLTHEGTFLCSRFGDATQTKTVAFRHRVEPPNYDTSDLPNVGKLREFYSAFGSLLMYHEATSGDAARYLASPDQWPELHEYFSDWIRGEDELLPSWVASCLVIGEEPQTGNYILMPVEGVDAGVVFHFEHDGFEFTREAEDLLQYVEQLLDLTNRDLAFIATHMHFVEGDPLEQWCIEELHDNRGNFAKTNL